MNITHVNLAKGFRGGERQTYLLIEQLALAPDINQILVCRHDSPLKALVENLDRVTIVTTNHPFSGHKKTQQADLVHAHDAKAVHWAWLHSTLYKTPYVITRRIDNPVKPKYFNKVTYTNASRRVAVSSSVKAVIEKNQWGKVNCITDAYAKLSACDIASQAIRDQYANQFLLGHIGALVEQHKGQRLLLKAAENLLDSHPDIQFLFYGRGKDEQVLKQESAHLPNVHFCGFSDDIGSVISAFDLFAFPSRMEGLGSTLLDVMYFDVPIIASNAGGIPDVVHHNQTGMLFDNGDVEALTTGIISLYQNPQLRAKLAQKAKENLDFFSPAAMAQRYVSLYHEVLGLG